MGSHLAASNPVSVCLAAGHLGGGTGNCVFTEISLTLVLQLGWRTPEPGNAVPSRCYHLKTSHSKKQSRLTDRQGSSGQQAHQEDESKKSRRPWEKAGCLPHVRGSKEQL